MPQGSTYETLSDVLAIAILTLGPRGAAAPSIIGDLNNFDTLNDTGQICYGFEIEIDGIHSTDITYTFDWNHYGVPKILEDNSDPAHPRVFVRYESTKDSNGQWGAGNSFTNQAIPTITPPQGHTCTDTSINEGCEHFGVGYYGVPAAIKYNWLVDGGAGNLVYFGSAVSVATPTFVYTPPLGGQPAQVVAAIPAPVVPIPAGKQFGEPSFVKVIKTTSHNANPVELRDLVSADADGDGKADWQNQEPDETETEWTLLQANTAGRAAKAELQGAPDDMADGSEQVTRRYEFYRYGAALNTLDGENGEAMCDEVNPTTDPNDPNYLHGIGSAVAVTDANGETYYVDCAAQIVVGNYIGAQMAGFAAALPLGLVDHLQDGESGTPYTPRTVVVGGHPPYTIDIPAGSLPPGLSFNALGVLSGTPNAAGDFSFTVAAVDGDTVYSSQTYSLHVVGVGVPQHELAIEKLGTGQGTVSGNGLYCGATCSGLLDVGTSVSLTAVADAGSRFNGWSGPCTGSAACAFTLNANTTVSATFTQQWTLSVGTAGAGTGSVTGNGIDCGATCSALLDVNTVVALVATPASGSVFTGWSGACSGSGACNATMTADQSVTATFVPATQLFTLDVTSGGAGTVTSSPKGINCGRQCSKSYPVGTIVTLTVKPSKKSVFEGWTDACSGTSLSCTVPMLSDRTVGAIFK